MKWLLSLILVLLAVGTLRVVGCGDEGPECIYPLDYAAGTVRDPACDDENECTEGRCYYGDICTNDAGFRDGQPCDSAEAPDACSIAVCVWDRCEITEKPCEVVPHEECGDVETYYCDPDTGVVECTLDTYWSQGQSCCLEYESWWSCARSGWCIAGACVTSAKGYPRDCTDRDDGEPCDITDTAVPCWCDGEPCDIEKTLGLCWKGKCAALDCGGLCGETRCWRNWSEAGVCYGPIGGQCRAKYPLTGGPPGWTCDGEYYGTDDGCDCGCGIIDPDCTDGTVGSCDYCGLEGSCNSLRCPGDIDPAQNSLCLGGTGVCGNGVVEHGELCDRDNLRGLDCTDLSFTGGTLVCTMECTFDTSDCTGGGGTGGVGGTGDSGGASGDG